MSNSRKIERQRVQLLALAAATVLLAAATPAFAEVRSWDGGGGNTSWHNAFNWNPDGIPTATTDVALDAGIAPGQFIIFNNGLNDTPANSLIISTLNSFELFGGSASLVLTSGDLTRFDLIGAEGDQTIGTSVKIAGDAVWNIGGQGALIVEQGVRQTGGTRNFTKTGNGLLDLDSISYTGTTTVSQGILRINIFDSQTPTSLITIAAGAELQLNDGFTNTPIFLQGTAGTAAVLRAVAPFGSFGTSQIGQLNLGLNNSVVADLFSQLTIAGGITDGPASRSWAKNGDGKVILTGVGDYNGNTLINAGILRVERNDALGSGTAIVATGATLDLAEAINLPNDIQLAGTLNHDQAIAATASGNITLTGNATINTGQYPQTADLALTGSITDNGNGFALTKTGPGILRLSGAYMATGPVTVAGLGGTLRISAPMLGGAPVAVGFGATLELQGGLNINRPLELTNVGDNGVGALLSSAGVNTWSGPVTLSNATSIGVSGGSTLSITGGISGATAFTKIGAGILVLAGNNSYVGPTNINAGTLRVSGGEGIPNASGVTIANGATLELGANETITSLAGGGPTGGVNLGSSTLTIAGNASTTFAGPIVGQGNLVKRGTGAFTISGVNTYSGTTLVQQGTLRLGAAGASPGNSALTVEAGAVFDLNGINGALAELNGNGQVLLGAVNLTVKGGNFAGIISGSGALIKNSNGPLTLGGVNTYSGGTALSGGTLLISSDANLGDPAGGVNMENGGKLLVTANTATARTFNLNSGSIQVNSGITLSYNGATVSGGFLRGPGNHAINSAGGIFSGVTTLAGSNITQTASTTLNNFTNAGNFSSAAPLLWDGGFNASSGILFSTAGTITTTAFTNDGAITLNNGASLINAGNPLVSGGGSRITINSGGTLNVTGNSLELNGSLLVNNGTISGTTNVSFSALAKGAGVYGAVNVTDGGKFSPGNSPGSVITGSTTWNSGGSYLVEIADALGGAGNGWDVWNINGSLSINAGSTTNGKFTIFLSTMEDLAAGFDPSRDYDWTILSASDGITGFDPAKFAVNVSGFKNDLHGGHFSISSSGSELLVHFAGVPELSISLFLISTFLARFSGRRRR